MTKGELIELLKHTPDDFNIIFVDECGNIIGGLKPCFVKIIKEDRIIQIIRVES